MGEMISLKDLNLRRNRLEVLPDGEITITGLFLFVFFISSYSKYCYEEATVLRWLDWIFWGWYLPSLSIIYVGMSKDMENRLPQLYYIKMKISYDLGFIVIGVAMAT